MDETILRYNLHNILNWCYGGVNETLPGNGGPECAAFIPLKRKCLETIFGCFLSLFYLIWGYCTITYPTTYPFIRKDRGGKRMLLVLVSLVFGIEIGFKFATKQLVYLLNPCHVITAIQIYLLAAPPSQFVTAVFRVHLNFLNGAILALLFPVTNTRMLPFETEIYWIQHLLILVTPYYLLRLGGVYVVEELYDFSWSTMSTGIQLFYHFLLLQFISLATQVNLNNMLCPAISDPFYGPHYRLAAVVHQSLCIPLVSKLFCVGADFFITKFSLTKIKDHLQTDVTISAFENIISMVNHSDADKQQCCETQTHLPRNDVPNPTQYIHRRCKSEVYSEMKDEIGHED